MNVCKTKVTVLFIVLRLGKTPSTHKRTEDVQTPTQTLKMTIGQMLSNTTRYVQQLIDIIFLCTQDLFFSGFWKPIPKTTLRERNSTIIVSVCSIT